jgi:DNA primase
LGRSRHAGQKSFKWKLPNGKYSKGDINPAAMPLYNSELVTSWPEGCRIVLVEGETPADALRKRGIKAVGTVCGATLTPDRDVLEVLSGHEVIAWSDNDAAGLAHMRRCAALLEGIASAVRWFEWAEAPHKGTPRTIQP